MRPTPAKPCDLTVPVSPLMPDANPDTDTDPDAEIELITLREVVPSDLPIFYEQQRDPEANRMAAFVSRDPDDREACLAHWDKILADETVVARTILYGGQVAGHVAKFERDGRPEVTYWIDRQFWNKGIATGALARFLHTVTVRPIYGAAAADNVASLRVLQKCGFTVVARERAFANARSEVIQETILTLTGSD